MIEYLILNTTNKMNKLPRYWCVRNDDSLLFKDTVIEYINKLYRGKWMGNAQAYYGCGEDLKSFNGGNCFHSPTSFSKDVVILTLEQFIELSKEEFVLPKHWYIKVNEENKKVLAAWSKCPLHVDQIVGIYKGYSDEVSIKGYNSENKIKGDGYDFGQEITFEQFREYVLKIKTEFVLPKKWCIRVNDQLIVDYCNEHGRNAPYYKQAEAFAHFPVVQDKATLRLRKVEGYTEITLEQFKKHVLKPFTTFTRQDWVAGLCVIEWEEEFKEEINAFFQEADPNNSKAVGAHLYYKSLGNGRFSSSDWVSLPIVKIKQLLNEKPMEKKIIGYLAPMDLFDGKVKKGDVFKLYGESYRATHDGILVGSFLPKEIVETWVSIYEEPLKPGDWVIVIASKSSFSEFKNAIGYVFKLREDSSCATDTKFLKGERSLSLDASNRYSFNYARYNIRKATKEEVTAFLLKEAKEKYPKGTKFKSVADSAIYISEGDPIDWPENPYSNTIANNPGVGLLYVNGKWAEIITYPDVTINGYKGQFFSNYIKFGCAEISKELFLQLYAIKDSTWTNGKEIESVTIGKGAFSKTQIKEIAEYYMK